VEFVNQILEENLELNWEVWICHTFREANSCADALVNLACDGGFSLIIYERCPVQISLYLLVDYAGVSTPRLIRHYCLFLGLGPFVFTYSLSSKKKNEYENLKSMEAISYVACIVSVLLTLLMLLTFKLQRDGILICAKRFRQRWKTSCRNCLPSILQLQDRGVTCSTNCVLCDKGLEDSIGLCFHS